MILNLFFTGIGFGVMFLASVVVVGFYFEKNRGIAATLAMCGSSVGMAVIAPLTRFLLDKYGWQGSVVILSGIALNGCVFSKWVWCEIWPSTRYTFKFG